MSFADKAQIITTPTRPMITSFELSLGDESVGLVILSIIPLIAYFCVTFSIIVIMC